MNKIQIYLKHKNYNKKELCNVKLWLEIMTGRQKNQFFKLRIVEKIPTLRIY